MVKQLKSSRDELSRSQTATKCISKRSSHGIKLKNGKNSKNKSTASALKLSTVVNSRTSTGFNWNFTAIHRKCHYVINILALEHRIHVLKAETLLGWIKKLQNYWRGEVWVVFWGFLIDFLVIFSVLKISKSIIYEWTKLVTHPSHQKQCS